MSRRKIHKRQLPHTCVQCRRTFWNESKGVPIFCSFRCELHYARRWPAQPVERLDKERGQ